jgi:hypothetical protein
LAPLHLRSDEKICPFLIIATRRAVPILYQNFFEIQDISPKCFWHCPHGVHRRMRQQADRLAQTTG